MPRINKMIGLHLSDEAEQKLAALAKATFRSRSGVVRLLLSKAEVAGEQDIDVAPIRLAADEAIR